jgi:hypothetical protein
MLKQELIKLAKNKDKKHIPYSKQLRYGLASGAVAHGMWAPGIVIGPGVLYYSLSRQRKANLGKIDKLKLLLSAKEQNRFIKNSLKELLARHIGVVGSSIIPILSSPDSVISRLSPIMGFISSLPGVAAMAYGPGALPRKYSLPLVMLYSGTAAGVPAFTRALKKRLYEFELKKKKT